MRRALGVELLKLRRSTVVITTTVLMVVLAPLLSLGFVTIAENGGAGAAALKTQAMVVGEGWEAYLALLAQMVAVTAFIGPGVVVAWAFGREHADRTFGALFALTVSRRALATAKFVVLLCWGLVVTALLLLSATLIGMLAGMGPLAEAELLPSLARLFLAGGLTSTISLTVGLVASVGRGYLPAIGAVILLTALAQIAVLLGTGGWFPYAAPGLYAMEGTVGVTDVGALQLLLVPMTTAAAAWLTVEWWERTEVV